ncbi:MAG: asparaginase [Leucobacter sp.]|nr:asparaginase [Leucobacter sp.]
MSTAPTVLVFATGGTIGMRRTDRGLAPDPAFPDALDALVASICAPLAADYRVNHLSPAIDSANADADTAPRIARAIGARARTVRPRGVVVTHGTDTLAYTAARLAFELADLGMPVVLTGSQLPYGDAESDARANLALAIRAALRAKPDAPVSIAFGGALLPAVRATKFQADAFEAFRAERPLAPSRVGLIGADAAPADPGDPARVIPFRFAPGTTAADLRAASAGEPDGIVLECYGSGNAPMAKPGMAAALRDLCAELPVVAVTQCATGGVDFARYAVGHELEAAGVIDGGDMTIEAALAKLGYALDRGAQGASLRGIMSFNLVGELG